ERAHLTSHRAGPLELGSDRQRGGREDSGRAVLRGGDQQASRDRPVRVLARGAAGVIRAGGEADGRAVGGLASRSVVAPAHSRLAGSGGMRNVGTRATSLLITTDQRAVRACSRANPGRDSRGAYPRFALVETVPLISTSHRQPFDLQ